MRSIFSLKKLQKRNVTLQAFVLLVLFLAFFFYPAHHTTAIPEAELAADFSSAITAEPVTETEPQPVPAPAEEETQPAEVEEEAEETIRIVEGNVGRNNTFSGIMAGQGIKMKLILELVQTTRSTFNLNRLKYGQRYEIGLDEDNTLVSFAYDINPDRRLQVIREQAGFRPEVVNREYQLEPEVIEGTIESNLIASVKQAGGSHNTAIKLAELFSWNIDFFKDLQKGDRFKIMVEKKFREGQYVRDGRILAATFTNRGTPYHAVYFEDASGGAGYYTIDGHPLKKQFLKAPLRYSRISSRFNPRRFHPIYKKYLPHLGIDYAAPHGTPVLAVGDGTVITRSRNARSGNFILLRHANGYQSVYSHLSRFARGLRTGSNVEQGQVIGYVGATGSATGPHLCFKLKQGGKAINPLTFHPPGSPPLEDQYLEAFYLTALQRMFILNRKDLAEKITI